MSLETNLNFKKIIGSEFESYLNSIGRLRICVFREWPYLYQGDLEYETKYLQKYVNSERSFAFLIFNKQELVGATTAIPLIDETCEVQKPFIANEIDVSKVIYFGESILLPEFRGRGFGKRFMQERIDYARALKQFEIAAFCAVVRDPNDKRRPDHFQSLTSFWSSQGFVRQVDCIAKMSWQEIGHNQETEKNLEFWIKQL